MHLHSTLAVLDTDQTGPPLSMFVILSTEFTFTAIAYLNFGPFYISLCILELLTGVRMFYNRKFHFCEGFIIVQVCCNICKYVYTVSMPDIMCNIVL